MTDEMDIRESYRELRSARATFVASHKEALMNMSGYANMIHDCDKAMTELKLKAINSGVACIHNKGQKCLEPELWIEGCGQCVINQEVFAIENERQELSMQQADEVYLGDEPEEE